jgi:peptidoglycan/LPS O-acetylase OafA/YrhL
MAWVVYLGASGGARLGRFWSGSVPAYLGKISYGLYAYHGLVFGLVAGRWVYMMPQGPIRIPLMLTITLIVAIVSYEFYERPFLRLKNRFQTVPSGAAC